MKLDVTDEPWCCNAVRCEIDGRDITNDVIAASEEDSWALIYQRKQPNGLEEVQLSGKIVFFLKDTAPENAQIEFNRKRIQDAERLPTSPQTP